jgi:S-adenosylmethionine hydrolase
VIALFTDYGVGNMYVGQMHAVLAQRVPRVPVIDLLHDAPRYNVGASAHLLAALVDYLPGDTVVVAVVDPGVGGDRDPVMVKHGNRWLVGPDNGLLDISGAGELNEWFRIDWRPEDLSMTFHGRDLFAPVAAMLAEGHLPVATGMERPTPAEGATRSLSEIIYVDHYGNAFTGLQAADIAEGSLIRHGNRQIGYASCFDEAPADKMFWYRNSIGMVEIAVARDSAADRFQLSIGDRISVVS